VHRAPERGVARDRVDHRANARVDLGALAGRDVVPDPVQAEVDVQGDQAGVFERDEDRVRTSYP
jgi:hypothetical protein